MPRDTRKRDRCSALILIRLRSSMHKFKQTTRSRRNRQINIYIYIYIGFLHVHSIILYHQVSDKCENKKRRSGRKQPNTIFKVSNPDTFVTVMKFHFYRVNIFFDVTHEELVSRAHDSSFEFRKRVVALKDKKIRDLDIANLHTTSPLSVAWETDQDVPWKTTLIGALYLELFLTTTTNFVTNTLRTPSSQSFRSTNRLSKFYVRNMCRGHDFTSCWFVILMISVSDKTHRFGNVKLSKIGNQGQKNMFGLRFVKNIRK